MAEPMTDQERTTYWWKRATAAEDTMKGVVKILKEGLDDRHTVSVEWVIEHLTTTPKETP